MERIRLLCEAGVDKIILREKDLSEQEYEKLAANVLGICAEYPLKCMLHSYVNVVKKLISSESGGLHLPMPLLRLNSEKIWKMKKKKCVGKWQTSEIEGNDILFGASAHSLEDIFLAQEYGADYACYSPVFETTCKPGAVPKGIKALKEVCEKSPLPVYALGGISVENAKLCLTAGAAGVCVMSFGMTASFEEILGLKNICHG